MGWLPTSIPWVPCFDARGEDFNVTFQCANLTVPVNYLDPTQNKTTQVGMAKAHPIELKDPLGLLFTGLLAGASYLFYLVFAECRDVLSGNGEFQVLPTGSLNVTKQKE